MMRSTAGLLVALALGLLAAPLVAAAQQPPRAPRICLLAPYSASEWADRYNAFLQGLRDLGYVEGRNITVDYLSADGQLDRFPALAGECLRLKADIILTPTTPGTLAAKQATNTIPIVMGATGDPVGTGLVASLARPGGNVTGPTEMASGLSAKRLELLKEAVPGISRVGVLSNLGDAVATPQVKELEDAARILAVQLSIRDVRTAEDLPAAVARAARDGAQGLLTTVETIFVTNRTRVVELAARRRLPAMYPHRVFADAGGLMSYGPNIASLYRKVATYVDKILKGAKPADLPVEQPTKFELVLNMKTAKALGLTIPPSVLIRADQVIQ